MTSTASNTSHAQMSEKSRTWIVFKDWLFTLAPSLVLVIAGLTVFRGAVLSSIASTPHPELVYVIFIAYLTGLILTCRVLVVYAREENLLNTWSKLSLSEATQQLTYRTKTSNLSSIYQILEGHGANHPAERQSRLAREIKAATISLESRLALPNYLAGSLVGLGLVGTFVGLLGTLEELGHLFGALMNTGNSSLSPTEVFGDMVRRLQEPMRSMGTAFVASLYGLLGSLLLGLTTISVNKVAQRFHEELEAVVRAHEASSLKMLTDGANVTDPSEMLALYRTHILNLQATSEQLNQRRVEDLEQFKVLRQYLQEMLDALKKTTLQSDIRSDAVHQAHLTQLRSLIEDFHKRDKEAAQQLERTSQHLSGSIGSMQLFVERSVTESQMLRQTLHDLNQQVQAQGETLGMLSGSVRNIDQLLTNYLAQPLKLTLTVDPVSSFKQSDLS